MRKEFEENEESKKILENNLEIQDEIDDETFQKILERRIYRDERNRLRKHSLRTKTVEDLKLHGRRSAGFLSGTDAPV